MCTIYIRHPFLTELGTVVLAYVVAGLAADVQAVYSRVGGAERLAGHCGARRHQCSAAACASAARQGQASVALFLSALN